MGGKKEKKQGWDRNLPQIQIADVKYPDLEEKSSPALLGEASTVGLSIYLTMG